MKLFNYIMYLFKHKWYVFLECKKRGIIWRGITHDLSKFFPCEFFPYMEKWYGSTKRHSGYRGACLHHYNHNTHHWQYWVFISPEGKLESLEMPEIDRKEMIADWVGMARTLGKEPSAIDWYERNKDKILLHKETRRKIEEEIGYGRIS